MTLTTFEASHAKGANHKVREKGHTEMPREKYQNCRPVVTHIHTPHTHTPPIHNMGVLCPAYKEKVKT